MVIFAFQIGTLRLIKHQLIMNMPKLPDKEDIDIL